MTALRDTPRRIWVGAAFLAAASVVGVVGYVVAGWDVLEAIYMVVITFFGVGYGEVREIDTPELRLFTILLIVAGCSSVVYILGGFFQLITEGYVNEVLGKRRMGKEIERLRDHVIICGYGRIGLVLAEELRRTGTALVIVDTSSARTQQAIDDGHLALCADATEEATLSGVSVERARALASALPNDALNVFITLTARNMKPDLTIVARAEHPTAAGKLRQAGADKVVLPSGIGAVHMAHSITRPSAVELFEDGSLAGLRAELDRIGVEITELAIEAGSEFDGHDLRTLESRGIGGFIVIAVRRDGETTHNPGHDFKLKGGDQVLVLGRVDNMPDLNARRGSPSRRPMYYRGARVDR